MSSLKSYLLLGFLLLSGALFAQDEAKVVQLSGQIADERGVTPLYTNVSVKGTSRGTVCRIDGFYSLPVRENEVVIFSRIGFINQEYQVPNNVDGTLISKDIILKKDTLFLPEAVIAPWPDRDFFEIEFLALEVDNYLEDIAYENLSPAKLEILKQVLPVDGTEVSRVELQKTAQAYYSAGQFRPQNIFNPLSWKKFIEAIRRGDYKKKK